ncbi:MAG: PAS-domain containing protein, partial [Planctomycetota bacterium]
MQFPDENPIPNLADTILLSIQEGVTIYDTEFRLCAWNDKYAATGITPPDAIRIGLSIEETYRLAAENGVFGEGDPQRIAQERLEQVYAGTSPAIEDLAGSNGKTIEVRRYFLPNFGVAAVFSDVTQLRRDAARLRRHEDLKVLARATAGFAHDFGNALQIIAANLEVVRLTEKFEHLRTAMEATDSAGQLARTLLAIAQPGTFTQTARQFEVKNTKEKKVKCVRKAMRINVFVSSDM